MRKIDIFLIAIVAIYLCLVLPIFNKEHVMEFGNFSDILSSLSTFGTLCIAYIALRKAPEWLHQKMDEHAFNIAKDVMVYDFPTIYKILSEHASHLELFVASSKEFGPYIAFADIKELTLDMNKKIIILDMTSKKISDSVQSLVKLGWNLRPEMLDLYKKIVDYQNLCIMCLRRIHDRIGRIDNLIKKEDYNKKNFDSMVFLMMERASGYSKIYNDYVDVHFDFFDAGGTVPEYFNIKPISLNKS